MKQKIIFCVLTISLLASCAKTTPLVSLAPLATETLVPMHTATVAVTNTSTPRPTPTITATATPTGRVTKNCLFVSKQETALQNVATGTIIYFPENGKYYVAAKNLQTGEKFKLPTEKFNYPNVDLAVSPDGNKVAYLEKAYGYDVIKTILWIVNAHGDVLHKITFNYGLSRTHWLDNEWLIFYIWETDKNGRELMVNPFKHEQHYVWNELPNFQNITKMWWITWLVDYSPDLKWVVYWDNWNTIVYDIEHKQDIWKSSPGAYEEHAWSPDGNELAIVENRKNPNLYIINRNGSVKSILDNSEKNLSQRPSWSPDGRYLAFLNGTAMLYDKQTDQVTNYCIVDETYSDRPLLWSPNSQQIILDGNLNPGADLRVLIDVQKNVAYKLSDFPVAWMNSLP